MKLWKVLIWTSIPSIYMTWPYTYQEIETAYRVTTYNEFSDNALETLAWMLTWNKDDRNNKIIVTHLQSRISELVESSWFASDVITLFEVMKSGCRIEDMLYEHWTVVNIDWADILTLNIVFDVSMWPLVWALWVSAKLSGIGTLYKEKLVVDLFRTWEHYAKIDLRSIWVSRSDNKSFYFALINRWS